MTAEHMSAEEIYRNLDQSLEAAQVLAQWVRWKTIARPGEISKTGHRRSNGVEESPIFLYGLDRRDACEVRQGNVHSSTQSSLTFSPASSCAATRAAHSSKWCLAGAHWAEFLQAVFVQKQSVCTRHESLRK